MSTRHWINKTIETKPTQGKYKPGDKLDYFQPVTSRDKYRRVPCIFVRYSKKGFVQVEFTAADGSKFRRLFAPENVDFAPEEIGEC